jgi:hypothetical protein
VNATTNAPAPTTPAGEPKSRSSTGTRVSSFVALCGVIGAMAFVGSTVYHVATDGFVAPIILSPDSDMVIQSKLSMSQLLAEKIRITSKREAIDVEIQGSEEAIAELRALHESASKSLEWATSINGAQAAAGLQDLRTLARQRDTLTQMLADEEGFLERMKKDLDAGLVSKAEYARELHAMNQLRVTSLDNDRSQIASKVQMNQVRLTQEALAAGGRPRIATPEMVSQQDQLVRVRCDMIRLQSERRSKLAERRSLDDELAKLDELLGQLKSRPIFRAIEANTNVAFIPYTQIEGVRSGTAIYDCIWGVFACKSVGHIAELLPGEAIVQDPWGSPARGQYAIMDLDDARAAQAKTLRVRPSSRPLLRGTSPASLVAKK